MKSVMFPQIRIETIAYFLHRYRDRMAADAARRRAIDAQVAAFESRLRAGAGAVCAG